MTGDVRHRMTLRYTPPLPELHEKRLGLRRRIRIAIGIAAATALIEVAGSWFSGSLALLSDAGHVSTDAFALGLSLWALSISERPHTPEMSFGYHRTEVLAALANAALLLAIAGALAAEAYGRYRTQPPISGGIMLLVGLAGLASNLVMLALLRTPARGNINVRGAFLHVYGDTLGSMAVVAGAILIQVTEVSFFDVIAALFVVILIAASGARLLWDSVRIILEASPAELAPQDVAEAIAAIPGVRGVHDLHIWTVTSGFLVLAGHVLMSGESTVQDASAVVDRVQAMLRERFGIAHATLQVDSLQDEIIASSDVEKRP
jgi:cobalt-zinc-cadmium efflux system protein